MKTPQAFCGANGILNRGMILVVLVYSCFGLCGFLAYGTSSAATVSLNLPKHELYKKKLN